MTLTKVTGLVYGEVAFLIISRESPRQSPPSQSLLLCTLLTVRGDEQKAATGHYFPPSDPGLSLILNVADGI